MAHTSRAIKKPKNTYRQKILKAYKKNTLRIRVLKEFLAGNYTSKAIPMDWAGKPLRSDLINQIIVSNGYDKYLEIGCHNDACFSAIKVNYKVGVDPVRGGTMRMTSDEFFATTREGFDIIFIDGLHLYEQVRSDIINATNVLHENGTIVLHDCLPTSCLAQYRFEVIEAWNGDVWKAFVEARTMPDLDSATCLIDHGVGVIKKRKNAKPLRLPATDFKNLKFADLANDYTHLLNTLGYEQAVAFASER